jgi:hypothetical protein
MCVVLLQACDGLWDVMSTPQAVIEVGKRLRSMDRTTASATVVCEALVQQGLMCGARFSPWILLC